MHPPESTGPHGDGRPAGPGLSALLHLCDSLFPTGSYAHSDGLEAATDAGQVVTGDDLRAWMLTVRDETLRRLDGPAIAGAWAALATGDWPRLRQLDDELYAMRPAASTRDASRSVGSRLLRTWEQIYPSAMVESAARTHGAHGAQGARAEAPAWTLPIAFTIAARDTGSDARTTLEAYSYTRLAGTAAAAMRLMRLGQVEAHTVLAEMLRGVPEMAAAVMASATVTRPSTFTPLADIAAMRQQYVTTRLFRS